MVMDDELVERIRDWRRRVEAGNNLEAATMALASTIPAGFRFEEESEGTEKPLDAP